MKDIVMGLNRNSVGGPDGMTRAFFQDAWIIIGKDIHNIVTTFFCGLELPKFLTHTNLVFLPKKIVVNIFSDIRSISLTNFINEIFSTIIH